MKLLRTDATHPDFIQLVRALDAYLAITDGDEHAFYDQYNQLDSIQYTIVAYDGYNAIGCGAIKELGAKSMEIKRMYTHPDHRGKGVASTILSALEQWAIELGYTTCTLETGKRQKEAVQFYQKCGYQQIPNYGQYIGMENSVCFQKELSQQDHS